MMREADKKKDRPVEIPGGLTVLQEIVYDVSCFTLGKVTDTGPSPLFLSPLPAPRTNHPCRTKHPVVSRGNLQSIPCKTSSPHQLAMKTQVSPGYPPHDTSETTVVSGFPHALSAPAR